MKQHLACHTVLQQLKEQVQPENNSQVLIASQALIDPTYDNHVCFKHNKECMSWRNQDQVAMSLALN